MFVLFNSGDCRTLWEKKETVGSVFCRQVSVMQHYGEERWLNKHQIIYLLVWVHCSVFLYVLFIDCSFGTEKWTAPLHKWVLFPSPYCIFRCFTSTHLPSQSCHRHPYLLQPSGSWFQPQSAPSLLERNSEGTALWADTKYQWSSLIEIFFPSTFLSCLNSLLHHSLTSTMLMYYSFHS